MIINVEYNKETKEIIVLSNEEINPIALDTNKVDNDTELKFKISFEESYFEEKFGLPGLPVGEPIE